MGDRKDLRSPLLRAKFGLITWIEMLPEGPKVDAMMALETFCDVANSQIEQAYMDGHNQRRDQELVKKYRTALSPGSTREGS